MKGVMQRATVHKAALRAIEHWQARFEERREAWIHDSSNALVGILWWRSPRGRDEAERIFNASIFNGGESGGVFFVEHSWLEIAANLAGLTERAQPGTIILKQEEVAALHPVLPKARGKAA